MLKQYDLSSNFVLFVLFVYFVYFVYFVDKLILFSANEH